MGYFFIEARNGETEKISGNKAGDQTGREVLIRSWYDYSWNYVLRYSDANISRKAVVLAKKLANSNLVGYDQGDRNTLYKALKKNGFDVDKYIASGELTEADCSSFIYAVFCCLIPSMRSDSNAPATGSYHDKFTKWGFSSISASANLHGSSLQEGDIYLREGYHVALASTTSTVASSTPTVNPSGTTTNAHACGETVQFTKVFKSSTSTEALTPKTKTGTITKVVSGRANPYLINNGDIGWTNDKYIYNSSPVTVPTIKKNGVEYKVGCSYKLLCELNVRENYGTSSAKVGYSRLTADGKKHDVDRDGALDAGTVVTCKGVAQDSNGNVWIKCPSGWMCCGEGSEIYIVKA